MDAKLSDGPLRIGSHTFTSRLIVGTGKYANYELMRDALEIAGAECITVAVRRERLIDSASAICWITSTRNATRSCRIRLVAFRRTTRSG